MSTSSSVRAASRRASSSSLTRRTLSLRPVRYCGIDVGREALRPAALHAARAPRARGDRARGDVLRARRRRGRGRARCSASAARRWSRSTRRPGGGSTCSRPGAPLRDELGAARRPLRALAGLRRAAVPPRAAALPGARGGSGARALGVVDGQRLRAVRGARAARAVPPGPPSPGRWRRSATARCGSAACARPIPDAVFCSLLGHRPSAEAHAVGPAAADRGAAAARRRRRRRRALAPHARRARRVRGGVRGVRARQRQRAHGSAIRARA